jgi:general secretion pathway protein J
MRAVAGFTLVEVVVALAILSLVMLTTITGLRTLANTQVSLERTTGRIDQVRTVSSFLRDTLESAAVGSSGAGGLALGGRSREAAYFEITPEGLVWKSTILIGESFGGTYLLRVAREDDLLVLRWQEPGPSGAPGEDWSEAQERTLVEDLQEFELAWREEAGDDWQQEWEKGDVVGWVRLQLRASDRYWPELVIQVPQ